MSLGNISVSSDGQHCVLVTGAAGFIGSGVVISLLEQGFEVIAIDSLNDYYDPSIKRLRASLFRNHDSCQFIELNIMNMEKLENLFQQKSPHYVIHLAAQAGVRFSLSKPNLYIDSNIQGTLNILECCRHYPVRHLLFASSSSVYGLNGKMPYAETDSCDHPVSLYAATKKSNEMMAHSYSHLYDIPVTGMRFFTVYGPYGRPDMACWKFIESIMNDRPIEIYNNGEMSRDFTYIDDVVSAISKLLVHIPTKQNRPVGENYYPYESSCPFAIYNIGKGQSNTLMEFVNAIEKHSGRVAAKKFVSMQPGDVISTWASCDRLAKDVGHRAVVSLDHGVRKFVEWYFNYTKYGK